MITMYKKNLMSCVFIHLIRRFLSCNLFKTFIILNKFTAPVGT